MQVRIWPAGGLLLALLCGLFIGPKGLAQSAATQTQEMTADSEIDDEAIAVLKNLGDHLAGLERFSYRYEAAYDAVQQSGVKVEFGSSRDITVERPNRMHSEITRRDGVSNRLIFTGETIFAVSDENQVYASVAQPGELDDAIDFAATELNLRAPAAAIVSSNFYTRAIENLTRAYYLGVSTIAGEDCDHLLLSNDFTDFQIWVTRTSQPVPRRVVITYREAPGEPQFRAHFSNWQFAVEVEDDFFQFNPPENYHRVRFYVAPAPIVDEPPSDQPGEQG